jgi:endo-1,4-beta-xylanase
MRFQLPLLAGIAILPFTSAQLNELARKAGKLYFGTALDNVNIGADERYMKILNDTREFGQLTPANGQKVSLLASPPFLPPQFSLRERGKEG